jgi:hypothetical protein
VIAVALAAANCWAVAVIVAGVALALTARGVFRSVRPVKAPRPNPRYL